MMNAWAGCDGRPRTDIDFQSPQIDAKSLASLDLLGKVLVPVSCYQVSAGDTRTGSIVRKIRHFQGFKTGNLTIFLADDFSSQTHTQLVKPSEWRAHPEK